MIIVLTTIREMMVMLSWWWKDFRGRVQGRERRPFLWVVGPVFPPSPSAGLVHLCLRHQKQWQNQGVTCTRLGPEALLCISALIHCNYIRFCPFSEICGLHLLLQPPSVHLLFVKIEPSEAPLPWVPASWHVTVCSVFPCLCLTMSWCHSGHRCS